MNRSTGKLLWLMTIGLTPLIFAGADGPTRWRGVSSGQEAAPQDPNPAPIPKTRARPKSKVTPAALRDDALRRTSQDVPIMQVPQGTTSPPPPTTMPDATATPTLGLDPLADEPFPALPKASNANVGAGSVELHFPDIDVRKLLEVFSRRERMNLLVSPNVAGTISIDIDGVTRDQALQAIMTLAKLEARRDNGVIFIYTAEEFAKDNLDRRKRLTRVYRLNYVRANEIMEMIQPFLSTTGKAASTPASAEGIDENANFAAGLPVAGGGGSGAGGGGGRSTGGNTLSGDDVLIVQDFPENLDLVDNMVSRLDVMPKQVLIEAVIIRVDLTNGQNLGANFGVVDNMRRTLAVVGNGTTLASAGGFTPLKVLTAGGSLQPNTAFDNGVNSNYGLSFGFIGGNLSAFIAAVETMGKTDILATPRLLVLNKQRAEIQLGNRLGFATVVTNLTSTVQQIQFLNTGTLLRLRPFISEDNMIRMEIHPERSTGALNSAGIPQTNTARMTTNVIVPNGATLVIGGLIENEDDVTQSGFPILGRLPLVGAAFRNRTQALTKSEVVILLTPRIWSPADPEGLNCLPTNKTSLDTAERINQKIELGSDRRPVDGLLGGRVYRNTPRRADNLQANDPGGKPYLHEVKSGENFWTISRTYYRSGRYYMALWAANKDKVPAPDKLKVGAKIMIPRADQLDPTLVQPLPGPGADMATPPPPPPVIVAPPPPPANAPGPFGFLRRNHRDPAAVKASAAPPAGTMRP